MKDQRSGSLLDGRMLLLLRVSDRDVFDADLAARRLTTMH